MKNLFLIAFVLASFASFGQGKYRVPVGGNTSGLMKYGDTSLMLLSYLKAGDTTNKWQPKGSYLTSELDPAWSAEKTNYYSKTNMQTSGQAVVDWGNIANAPAFVTQNFVTNDLSATGNRTHNFKNLYNLSIDSIKILMFRSDSAALYTGLGGFKVGNLKGLNYTSLPGGIVMGFSNGGEISAKARGALAGGMQALNATFAASTSAIVAGGSGGFSWGYSTLASDSLYASASGATVQGAAYGGDIFALASGARSTGYAYNPTGSQNAKINAGGAGTFVHAISSGSNSYVSATGQAATIFAFTGDASTNTVNDTVSATGIASFTSGKAFTSSKVINNGYAGRVFASAYATSTVTNTGYGGTLFVSADTTTTVMNSGAGGLINGFFQKTGYAGNTATGGFVGGYAMNDSLYNTSAASFVYGKNVRNYATTTTSLQLGMYRLDATPSTLLGRDLLNYGKSSYLFGSGLYNGQDSSMLFGWGAAQLRLKKDSVFLTNLPRQSTGWIVYRDSATGAISWAPGNTSGTDANALHLTGNETAAGNKTFSNFIGIGTTPSYPLHINPAAPATVTSGSGTPATSFTLFLAGQNGGDVNATTGTPVGGSGGKVYIHAGVGGNVTGTPTNGVGGNGGYAELYAGDGGSGVNQGGDGGVATLAAGSGGISGSGNGGAGGKVEIKGGNSGTSGNSTGGSIYLIGGNKSGTGDYGDIYLGALFGGQLRGNVRVGSNTTPTARVHIAGGTTTLPPFKLDASANTTTVQDGALEYDGVDLTFAVGTTRKKLTGGVLAANNLSDLANAATARTNLGLTAAAVAAIANNLTTTTTGSVLDARQGKTIADSLAAHRVLLDQTFTFKNTSTGSTTSDSLMKVVSSTEVNFLRLKAGTNTTFTKLGDSVLQINSTASGGTVTGATIDSVGTFNDISSSNARHFVIVGSKRDFYFHAGDSLFQYTITKVALPVTAPTAPTGTASTFTLATGTQDFAQSTSGSDVLYSTQLDWGRNVGTNTIPASTNGRIMAQYKGTSNLQAMLALSVNNTRNMADAAGGANFWCYVYDAGAGVIKLYGDYDNYTNATPSGSRPTLQVGDWYGLYRDGATGNVKLQYWRSTANGGTGAWVDVQTFTAATSTAIMYRKISAYGTSSVTRVVTNPKYE